MFSFRIKNVFLSSSSSSFTKLEKKKIHFLAWTNVATELCQDFLRFDVKYTHRARNRQEPMRPTNEYIMVMDVSNNIWKIRLNKKLASDLKPSLSVVFFLGEVAWKKFQAQISLLKLESFARYFFLSLFWSIPNVSSYIITIILTNHSKFLDFIFLNSHHFRQEWVAHFYKLTNKFSNVYNFLWIIYKNKL